MEQEILNKLEEKLYRKYKSLTNGFLFIENYEGMIVLNWNVQNDLNINYLRVKQISSFMFRFLKKHNQEGFFYTATDCIEVN